MPVFGAEAYTYQRADTALGAHAYAGLFGIGGEGGLHIAKAFLGVAEHAATANFLAGLGLGFQAKTRSAAQL